MAFPTAATPFFGLGVFFFLLRCLCVRNERLPFRMPLGLSGTDKGDPLPGRRGFAKPEGIFFLGNRLQDGKELWLKAKDVLTHTLLFGTTGSGKTETLVSLSYNALATGSGLFYIDPKSSPQLSMQIWQLARFLGRDDDFRVLNYGTSGKPKGKSPRVCPIPTIPSPSAAQNHSHNYLCRLCPHRRATIVFFPIKRRRLLLASCMPWWICGIRVFSNFYRCDS